MSRVEPIALQLSPAALAGLRLRVHAMDPGSDLQFRLFYRVSGVGDRAPSRWTCLDSASATSGVVHVDRPVDLDDGEAIDLGALFSASGVAGAATLRLEVWTGGSSS